MVPIWGVVNHRLAGAARPRAKALRPFIRNVQIGRIVQIVQIFQICQKDAEDP
jgi:hypothetical protein